jgi:hypothetical protein
VLAREVLLEQLRGDPLEPGGEHDRAVGARRHCFERDRILDGMFDIRSPRERPVRRDECSGYVEWLQGQRRERLHDHPAGLLLVVALGLGRSQLPGHGHGPVEVVGVRRTETRQLAQCLRPRRGKR